MQTNIEQLGDFIKDSGLVSKTDFDKAIKKAEKEDVSLGEVLISDGKLTEDEMRRIQAHILGIPFVDLTDQRYICVPLSLSSKLYSVYFLK